MAVKEVLKQMGLHFIIVDLGEVQVMETLTENQMNVLQLELQKSGLELMLDKRTLLVAAIMKTVEDMIDILDQEIVKNQSEYISKKLNVNYSTLSNLFSEIKGSTIQQYIITQKIERVKDLLLHANLSLTALSYKLNYSSVAHLSTQFKKVTGMSPTEFKLLKQDNQLQSWKY